MKDSTTASTDEEVHLSDVHPELQSARWLPRRVFCPWLLPLYRLTEALQGLRSGERKALDGGGEAWIFRPSTAPSGPVPGVRWIHGGGLVMEHAAQDAGTCQALADELGAADQGVEPRPPANSLT